MRAELMYVVASLRPSNVEIQGFFLPLFQLDLGD